MHPVLPASAESLSRFEREAKAVAALNHPKIQALRITPDGRAWGHSVVRKLSDLYLIEGLK